MGEFAGTRTAQITSTYPSGGGVVFGVVVIVDALKGKIKLPVMGQVKESKLVRLHDSDFCLVVDQSSGVRLDTDRLSKKDPSAGR